jgi:MoaA/NifB/PqqE/SkfB family radical SAM enzyme
MCGRYPHSAIRESFDRTGKAWHIHMSGGEPFLYPGFAGLCRELTKSHYISINTNFSTNDLRAFADAVDPARVISINAGLHAESREKIFGKGMERFIADALYFQEKGFNISAGYIAYPPLVERMAADLAEIKKRGLKKAGAVVFRGYYDGKPYPRSFTTTEKERILALAEGTDEKNVMKDAFCFFGKECLAGSRFFKIDPAGNVTRCSTSLKRYGNIFEGKYRFDDKAAPCPMKNCNCPYEGIEYAAATTGDALSVTREVLKEMYFMAGREITLPKIARYIRERVKR